MPDGRMLVTERPPTGAAVLNPTAEGHMRVVTQTGQISSPIDGLPDNVGVLDVVLDPNFSQNHIVYFTYLERDPAAPRIGRAADIPGIDPAGLAVARGVLDVDGPDGPALTSTSIIWRQQPKIVSHPGSGEPGGRLAFSPDGTYLFIAAGDRQEFGPVQAMDNTLGKILRIYPDGTIPADNPFVGVAGALPEIWSLGHRNPYGLLFSPSGELWEHEMGPMGGDELNVIVGGSNYGWPYVSYGDHYDGTPIPRPSPGDGYAPSAHWWTPVIAPSGMIIYSGTTFSQWQGDAIISGLQSDGLVIVDLDGALAVEDARIDFGVRLRDVVEGPDGTIWTLYDGSDGLLVQLSPEDGLYRDVRNDFNRDGQSDILWRNDDGTVGDWLGTANGDFVYNVAAGVIQVSTDWHIAGTGDFNGDGRDDILWRNDDGAFGNWLGTAKGGFFINDAGGLAQVPTDWNIVGSGDFNGDGRDDILWRNDDGAFGNWLGQTDGGYFINVAGVTQVSTDWNVVGSGDFNGDGRDDILWRRDDGALGNWLGKADGGYFINDANGLAGVPTDWTVAGSGDFDGDGRDDILWRNDDGALGNWLGLADGGYFINAAGVTQVPTDWNVAGTGDYNGDDRDDILWRNDNGSFGNWLGQTNGGFAYNAAAGLTHVSTDWHIQPDYLLV